MGGPDFFADFGEEPVAPADFRAALFGTGGGRSNLTLNRFLAGFDCSPFWSGSMCFPKIDGKCVESSCPVDAGGHMDWPTRSVAIAMGCLTIAGLLAIALRGLC